MASPKPAPLRRAPSTLDRAESYHSESLEPEALESEALAQVKLPELKADLDTLTSSGLFTQAFCDRVLLQKIRAFNGATPSEADADTDNANPKRQTLLDRAIKLMRDKEHGIVGHFSHATGVDGLGALHKCQRECRLPDHHPVKDNDTRWSSGHDQMEFFRVHQRAVQLYDINHAR